jgi:hypothetical protein
VRASGAGLPPERTTTLGSLSDVWYCLGVAERKGFTVASQTFIIKRTARLTDGRISRTVLNEVFATKRDAEKYLGLALYFPAPNIGEDTVEYSIVAKRA